MGRHSRYGSEYSVANEYYGLMVVIAIRLPAEHAEGDISHYKNIDILFLLYYDSVLPFIHSECRKLEF